MNDRESEETQLGRALTRWDDEVAATFRDAALRVAEEATASATSVISTALDPDQAKAFADSLAEGIERGFRDAVGVLKTGVLQNQRAAQSSAKSIQYAALIAAAGAIVGALITVSFC